MISTNQTGSVSTNQSRKDNAISARQSTRSSNTSHLDGKASQEKRPAKRGFAAMDPERQREIAAQGGRAAHESGNAHQFTSEEARAAGKKSHSGKRRAASTTGRRSNEDLHAAGKSTHTSARARSDDHAAPNP